VWSVIWIADVTDITHCRFNPVFDAIRADMKTETGWSATSTMMLSLLITLLGVSMTYGTCNQRIADDETSSPADGLSATGSKDASLVNVLTNDDFEATINKFDYSLVLFREYPGIRWMRVQVDCSTTPLAREIKILSEQQRCSHCTMLLFFGQRQLHFV
jgi:hypothetical protein